MSEINPHIDTYEKGLELSEKVNPGMQDALRDRYEELVPGLAEMVVDVAYGKFYARGTVDEKTRLLATIAALTALGGQTRPQLKINIASARRVGASQQEIAEIIYQMTLYGGFPAMINAMNTAIETFDEEGTKT